MTSRLSLVLLLALAFAAAPAAQNPPPGAASPQSQAPTFRSTIDSVSVDVTVTDKQGRPVSDLKADDFEITENKKPQSVQTFKLIKVEDSGRPEPAVGTDITSMDEMQRETSRDDTRVLVIFLDDYHVRRGNSMRVRQDLAQFISQLSPHDLVAIMYPLTSVNALTFSRNQDGTAAAVMGFEGRKYDYLPKNPYEQNYADYPPEMQEVLRRQITISALEGLALYLGTLRESKKQVLFVSEGLVGTMPPGTRTTGTSNPLGGRTAQPAGTQEAQDRAAFFNQVDVLQEMRRIFAAAARSNTSIYTLDPRGLATSEFQINDDVNSENDRRTLNEAVNSLRTLADQTDGRAIVAQNNPMNGLRQMLSDTSAYYLLGYTSTESARDGKFHEIQVRLKTRKDLQVRARKGYWAYTAEDIAKAEGAAHREGPPPEIEDALSSLASTGRTHAVRVWLGSDKSADGKTSVTFVWESSADAAADASDRTAASRAASADTVDHITLTATSIYGDMLFRGPVPRDPQAAKAGGRVTFDAPPGSVRLQIVAENAAGQRIDRDDQSADVPDFTAVGPVITTPMVFRGRTARDIQQIRAASSPAPTITREFSRTERLLLRFSAYGPGGTTPAVTMSLLNSLGKPMASLPAPTATSPGHFESEIGLGSLAAGEYLIQIATQGETGKAQTLVAIRVTG